MEHIHDGHRQRLRDKMLLAGPESLKQHEIVEFLLFYAVSRRNVNPLAHALIEHFGSLDSLFSAAPEDMMQVEGVTNSIAQWLHIAGNCIRAYIQSDESLPCLLNRRQTRLFLTDFFQQPGTDGCWLLCLSATGRLTNMLLLGEMPRWYDPENMRKAIAYALQCRAHSIILASKWDSCHLSSEDITHTMMLVQSLAQIQISLLEHVVIDPARQQFSYATNPIIQHMPESNRVAEMSSLHAHWLDEV